MDLKYIDNINIAKESIKVWLSNLEQLSFGNQMFAKANELNRNNIDFAKWYYSEGQTFSSFESFQVLEGFYNEMYDGFLEYIQVHEAPLKKSLFSNTKEKRQNQLEELYNDIKQKGRKLLKSIELFDEKLRNSPLFNDSFTNTNDFNFQDELMVEEMESKDLNDFFNFETPADRKFDNDLADTTSLMQQFFDLQQEPNEFDKIVQDTNQSNNDGLNRFDNFTYTNQDFEIINPDKTDEVAPAVQSNGTIDDISKLIDEQVKLKLNAEMEKIKQKIEKELLEKMKNNMKTQQQDNTNPILKNTEPIAQKPEINIQEEKINIKPKSDEIDLDEEIRRILS